MADKRKQTGMPQRFSLREWSPDLETENLENNNLSHLFTVVHFEHLSSDLIKCKCISFTTGWPGLRLKVKVLSLQRLRSQLLVQ